MENDNENTRLSPADAAAYLKTTQEKLAQYRRDKKGPYYTYERIVYLKKDLDAWIERNGK